MTPIVISRKLRKIGSSVAMRDDAWPPGTPPEIGAVRFARDPAVHPQSRCVIPDVGDEKHDGDLDDGGRNGLSGRAVDAPQLRKQIEPDDERDDGGRPLEKSSQQREVARRRRNRLAQSGIHLFQLVGASDSLAARHEEIDEHERRAIDAQRRQ